MKPLFSRYRNLDSGVTYKPMTIVIFASGSGGNTKAAIDLSIKKPYLIKIGLVVTDRFSIKAIDIAKKYKIPVISFDFEKECGVWANCQKNQKEVERYKKLSIRFHNKIYRIIKKIEKKNKEKFDLAVLAYHRWIHGDLLKYFNERMINQHAGDLTIMKKNNSHKRKYIGINPVLKALQCKEKRTRTSTFIVREGEDSGEILCQGPWVKYQGQYPVTKKAALEHELIQKKKSDWPCLTFALKEIAQGNFGLTEKPFYSDGCKAVVYKSKQLPYGGFDLSKNKVC